MKALQERTNDQAPTRNPTQVFRRRLIPWLVAMQGVHPQQLVRPYQYLA
jgi:hypothetical protein